VCAQLIQGNIPLDPDLLGNGDEKTGLTGGRFELSTSLSPAVDNSVKRRYFNGIRRMSTATMLSIPGHVTPSIDCGHKGLPLRNGVCNGYKVAKHDWKINEVSARIGAQWVMVPLARTDTDPSGEKVLKPRSLELKSFTEAGMAET